MALDNYKILEWDFTSDTPYVDKIHGVVANAFNVVPTSGRGVLFNGKTSYLEVSASSYTQMATHDTFSLFVDIEPTDMHNQTDNPSILSFLAGIWDETNNRSYGLFQSDFSYQLPQTATYGSARRVTARYSFTGNWTGGQPMNQSGAVDGSFSYSESGAERQQYTMTYNVNGEVRIYHDLLRLNGTANTQTVDPAGTHVYPSSGNFSIGACMQNNRMDNFFKGYIRRVILFNKELSASEVAQIVEPTNTTIHFGLGNSALMASAGYKTASNGALKYGDLNWTTSNIQNHYLAAKTVTFAPVSLESYECKRSFTNLDLSKYSSIIINAYQAGTSNPDFALSFLKNGVEIYRTENFIFSNVGAGVLETRELDLAVQDTADTMSVVFTKAGAGNEVGIDSITFELADEPPTPPVPPTPVGSVQYNHDNVKKYVDDTAEQIQDRIDEVVEDLDIDDEFLWNQDVTAKNGTDTITKVVHTIGNAGDNSLTLGSSMQQGATFKSGNAYFQLYSPQTGAYQMMTQMYYDDSHGIINTATSNISNLNWRLYFNSPRNGAHNRIMVNDTLLKISSPQDINSITITDSDIYAPATFTPTGDQSLATKKYVDDVAENIDTIKLWDFISDNDIFKAISSNVSGAKIELGRTDDVAEIMVGAYSGNPDAPSQQATIKVGADADNADIEIEVGKESSTTNAMQINLNDSNITAKQFIPAMGWSYYIPSDDNGLITRGYLNDLMGTGTIYNVNVDAWHIDALVYRYGIIDYLSPTYPGGDTTPHENHSPITSTIKLKNVSPNNLNTMVKLYQAIAKDYGYRTGDGEVNVLPWQGRIGVYNELGDMMMGLSVHGLAIYPVDAEADGLWTVEWQYTSDEGKAGSLVFFYEALSPETDIFANWEPEGMFEYGEDPRTASLNPFLGGDGGTVHVF